ncbi:hypothetical protein BKD26_27160 [Streptomyces sp. CB03238]|nr:hypothetical protein BKD26_27160 [Streptomyces sp. CB03238]
MTGPTSTAGPSWTPPAASASTARQARSPGWRSGAARRAWCHNWPPSPIPGACPCTRPPPGSPPGAPPPSGPPWAATPPYGSW